MGILRYWDGRGAHAMIIRIDIYTEDHLHLYYALERDRDGIQVEVQRYPTEKRVEEREIETRDAEHCSKTCPQFAVSETWGGYVCRLTGYAEALHGETALPRSYVEMKRTWKCKQTCSDARKGK
jgi:hypothetical protein